MDARRSRMLCGLAALCLHATAYAQSVDHAELVCSPEPAECGALSSFSGEELDGLLRRYHAAVAAYPSDVTRTLNDLRSGLVASYGADGAHAFEPLLQALAARAGHDEGSRNPASWGSPPLREWWREAAVPAVRDRMRGCLEDALGPATQAALTTAQLARCALGGAGRAGKLTCDRAGALAVLAGAHHFPDGALRGQLSRFVSGCARATIWRSSQLRALFSHLDSMLAVDASDQILGALVDEAFARPARTSADAPLWDEGLPAALRGLGCPQGPAPPRGCDPGARLRQHRSVVSRLGRAVFGSGSVSSVRGPVSCADVVEQAHDVLRRHRPAPTAAEVRSRLAESCGAVTDDVLWTRVAHAIALSFAREEDTHRALEIGLERLRGVQRRRGAEYRALVADVAAWGTTEGRLLSVANAIEGWVAAAEIERSADLADALEHRARALYATGARSQAEAALVEGIEVTRPDDVNGRFARRVLLARWLIARRALDEARGWLPRLGAGPAIGQGIVFRTAQALELYLDVKAGLSPTAASRRARPLVEDVMQVTDTAGITTWELELAVAASLQAIGRAYERASPGRARRFFEEYVLLAGRRASCGCHRRALHGTATVLERELARLEGERGHAERAWEHITCAVQRDVWLVDSLRNDALGTYEWAGALDHPVYDAAPGHGSAGARAALTASATWKTRSLAQAAEQTLPAHLRAASWECSPIDPVEAITDALSLQGDDVLVDFVRHSAARSDAPEAGYLAVVVPRDSPPEVVELGSAREIDDMVASIGARIASRRPTHRIARRLYRALFEPIQGALRDATSIVVSPDGALSHAPWSALESASGPFVDRYALTTVPSPQAIPRARNPRDQHFPAGLEIFPRWHGVAIFADPSLRDTIRSSGLASVFERAGVQPRVAPLTGARREGRAVSSLLGPSSLAVGAQATELGLRQTLAPGFLHLATHGLFLPDSDPERASALRRSMILLASGGGHDGVLDAEEILSDLDLRGTQLVALSACESGQGELDGTLGVVGMRYAILAAGAESLLTTLWRVDDAASAFLVRTFYGALARGERRKDALRRAALATRARWPHPYYWAGFLLTGMGDRVELDR